jgi:hypothetical protein
MQQIASQTNGSNSQVQYFRQTTLQFLDWKTLHPPCQFSTEGDFCRHC